MDPVVEVAFADPSPKLHVYENGPTPPVVLVVKVTVIPTSGEDGLATGAVVATRAATTTDLVGEADFAAVLSVIVTAARNVPGDA